MGLVFEALVVQEDCVGVVVGFYGSEVSVEDGVVPVDGEVFGSGVGVEFLGGGFF